MQLEEVWRRNEANMRRKQLQANTKITSSEVVDTSSPSTGAMDALFEKLRAAAPATRDTRDRRRRARLKDKHQLRVASGQKIPETGENLVEDGDLVTPTHTGGFEDSTIPEGGASEGEDIADRAASMLQGLRRDGDAETPGTEDALRVRRSRESADSERMRRRERRRRPGTESGSRTITEEIETDAPTDEPAARSLEKSSEEAVEAPLPTPTTLIVPPSPTVPEAAPETAEI